jgi:hypothetical protein
MVAGMLAGVGIGFGRANVETTVNLNGIDNDNFSPLVETFGGGNGFSDTGRSEKKRYRLILRGGTQFSWRKSDAER